MNKPQAAPKIAIVGAGISGLASAAFLQQTQPQPELLLFEASASLGGVVATEQQDSLYLERGPLSIAASNPSVERLLRQLDLYDALEPAETPDARFIYAEGALKRFSRDPRKLVEAGLLTRRGVARALAEPLIAKRSEGAPEAIWDYFSRRFGRELTENIIQPLLLGITTGETRDTDMETLFPELVRREREHGSLLRSFAKDAFGRRSSPRPTTYWLRGGGLQQIGARVRALPGVDTQLNTAITELEPLAGGGMRLHAGDAQCWDVDAVILATPTYVSAELLEPLAPAAAKTLAEVDYYGMALVQLVYEDRDLASLPRRMQLLVRRGQGIRMIAAQSATEIFPSQSTGSEAVLRCLYGGEFDRDASTLTQEALVRTARVELSSMLGLDTIPLREHLSIWPKAVPHFRPGHLERMREVSRALEAFPALRVIGAGVTGLSLSACIESAWGVANSLRRPASWRGGGVA